MIATLVELVYYITTLLGFYGYLIPTIGAELRDKCTQHRWCDYQLKRSFFGYRVDLTDGQWRDFRESLPLLISVAVLGIVLHKNFRRVQHNSSNFMLSRLRSTHFHLVFGSIVILVQHGWHSSVVVLISYGGYILAMSLWRLPRNVYLGIVFTYALFIICLKESYRLQHYAQFEFLHILFDRRYGGMYSWHVPANFLTLRIVSFMLDFQWAALAAQKNKKNRGDDNDSGADVKNVADCCPYKSSAEKCASEHCDILEYNLINFLSYCVYAPLYIAGPIVSFNTYIKYSNKPQESESVTMYGLRWLFAFSLMEMGTHYFPFFAIINTGLTSLRILYSSAKYFLLCDYVQEFIRN